MTTRHTPDPDLTPWERRRETARRWFWYAVYTLIVVEWGLFLWFAFIYGQAFADMP